MRDELTYEQQLELALVSARLENAAGMIKKAQEQASGVADALHPRDVSVIPLLCAVGDCRVAMRDLRKWGRDLREMSTRELPDAE